ncbi:MAG: osmoprotectant transporter permease [Proteobacteria bacterium]|nr:osmoprotectant transporter permease [Pseudomonadota bacterium]
MRLFYLFLTADVIALLIAVYFFFEGIGDGSISASNIGLWLVLLGGLFAVTGLGSALRLRGQNTKANVVLALVGIPTILAGLFVLTVFVSQPRWN